MARGQARQNVKKNGRQPRTLKDQGKCPQGISKQQTVRKSARLQAIRPRSPSISKSNLVQIPPSPPHTSNISIDSKRPQVLRKPSEPHQKRKRGDQARHYSPQDRDQPPPKRLRSSSSNHPTTGNFHQEVASDTSKSNPDPLEYWIKNQRWRKEYFEQDSQVREDFERGKSPEEFDERDWLQEHYLTEPFIPMHGLHHLQHLFARKKSSSSLRRKNSECSFQTPSDQLPRDIKSAQYKTVEYEIGLERKGSYMCKFKDGCKQEHIQILLHSEQSVPQDSLFRDDLFEITCDKIRNRNEAMVIRDISSLIVPSAQTLATYGATHLDHLYECVNEGWNSIVPFHGTRPQPDYSVGFGRSAFTEEQLKKLEPFVGEIGDRAFTYFMATTRMFFPFFTCEVKCGAAALDVADRQNAHSMTVAVKGVVELYRAVKRENELNQEILAFSISHDHSMVRLYGHYPVIMEDKTTFYRHLIRHFAFTDSDGKDRWTAYKFTKNVYDTWMPIQYKRICSAIDDLPSDVNFDLSQIASFSQSDRQSSSPSNVGSVWMLEQADSQSSIASSQKITPTTSLTQTAERASKKPRKRKS